MKKQLMVGVIVIIVIVIGGTTLMLTSQSSYGAGGKGAAIGLRSAAAPIATSGDNMYISWWTNKTGNDEVMFRASTNGGQTFGDKINLSNSSDTNSSRVEISALGSDVYVTWWETNQTSDEPVLRASVDNGLTFGPVLRLATNGTIGLESTEE